jgi:hypothetical protein
MSRYLSPDDTTEWVETVCAALDRLVANGLSANEAFASLPDGLPDQSRDALRLYWEVSRGTEFGQSVKTELFVRAREAAYGKGGS